MSNKSLRKQGEALVRGFAEDRALMLQKKVERLEAELAQERERYAELAKANQRATWALSQPLDSPQRESAVRILQTAIEQARINEERKLREALAQVQAERDEAEGARAQQERVHWRDERRIAAYRKGLEWADQLRQRVETLMEDQEEDGILAVPIRGVNEVLDAAPDLTALLAEKEAPQEVKRPTRWYEEMREWQASVTEYPAQLSDIVSLTRPLCWAYVADEEVCILDKGHDNGAHEPQEVNTHSGDKEAPQR